MISRRQLVSAIASTIGGDSTTIRAYQATQIYICQGAHMIAEVPFNWAIHPGVPGSITAMGGESGFLDAWPVHADSLEQASAQLERVYGVTFDSSERVNWNGLDGVRGNTISAFTPASTTSLIVPNPNPVPTIDGEGTYLHIVGTSESFDTILETVSLGITAVSPQDLAQSVIRVVRGHAYFRDGVDWDTLAKWATGLMTQSDVSTLLPSRLTSLLRSAGDKHTTVYDMRSRTSVSTARAPEYFPTGSKIGSFGYLSFPMTNGSTTEYHAEYAARGSALRDALYDDDVCGWIIDLRQMTGGSTRVLGTILYPFLPEGRVAGFVDVDGGQHWTTKSDILRNAAPLLAVHGLEPVESIDFDIPVAVLTGFQTASAGEFALLSLMSRQNLLSFGSATAGYTTANTTFHLFDGNMMALATMAGLDLKGSVHIGAIEPDIEDDSIGMSTSISETTLAPILNWLEESCSR
ncbi:MAG: S41 family peptidase [Thermomicrobiales bacterium]|nr:S41 family peptidase [Thermomicrobiales bacterium]